MNQRSDDRRVPELLAVPPEQRDLSWLERSLQVAVELELATLPVYLCGSWSCRDTAPLEIRGVIGQEMIHLGLAANLLTTIGGTPAINTTAPTYPCPLPGGLKPNVTLRLGALTKTALSEVYMAIEYPDAGPLTTPPEGLTIGQFYEAIDAALTRLEPPITGRNQQTATVNSDQVFEITDLTAARTALRILRDQGEGTATGPGDLPFGDPHYYRFAEFFHGARLEQVDGVWGFTGDPVEFPEVFPMAVVPLGGWRNPTAEVSVLLRQCNDIYTSLLDHLQAAWETGDTAALHEGALDDMFSLEQPAVALMKIPLPGGMGNYGPEFVYRP